MNKDEIRAREAAQKLVDKHMGEKDTSRFVTRQCMHNAQSQLALVRLNLLFQGIDWAT